MRATGCALFLLLIQCVSSVPVSPGHMDEEAMKVMKCIVEVLADALTKPHEISVSQQCLETLKAGLFKAHDVRLPVIFLGDIKKCRLHSYPYSDLPDVKDNCLYFLMTAQDDRLVTILRRRNFLQELQNIAKEGANDRSEKQMEGVTAHRGEQPNVQGTTADRSMLIGVVIPGEPMQARSSEDKSTLESAGREHDMITSHKHKNEQQENSDSMKQKQEQAMVKKAEDKEEEEKLSSLEEEDVEVGQSALEEEKKRKANEEKMRKEKTEKKMKPWSYARLAAHRRSQSTYDQQEALHHSKEIWKSPEEQELQMMARRDPDEGSASRKAEDAEMENLALIESELESMAQKLHKLRHV